MATNHAPPMLELDTTIADLLAADQGADASETLWNMTPSSDQALVPGLLPQQHYIYSSGGMLGLARDTPIFLSHDNLIFSSVAGDLPVYAMLPDDERHRENVSRFLQQLGPHQRPRVHYLDHIDQVAARLDTQRIRFSLPLDCARSLPTACPPDMHFELSGKRWLALSSLPTPKTEVIDSWSSCPEHGGGPWYYHEGCAGCERAVADEMQRVAARLQQQPLPFVVKLSQSQAAIGMSLVLTEEKLSETVLRVAAHLDGFLRQVNRANAHLRPSTIVVQEILPGQAVGISFYINSDGSYVWLGATPQIVEDEHFCGESVSYLRHEYFECLYKNTAGTLSRYLHGFGFSGPIGVDLMHDTSGTPLIVDINPRIPTSFILCLLRTHLSRNRGLHEAMSLTSILLTCDRDSFEAQFEEELSEARVIVVSACPASSGETIWMFTIVISSETKTSLRLLASRIKALQQH